MAVTSVNNINYVDFAKVNSIQMKQGDKTPIAIKLQQANASIRRDANLDEQETKATVYLSDAKEKKVIYKEEFEVKLGTVTLIINSVLPVGLYNLEIDYNGKKYPSDNSFSLMVNHSATVAPEDIKSLDTIEMVQENVLVSVTPKVQSFVDAKLGTEVAKYVNANKTMLKGDTGGKGDKGDKGDTGLQGVAGRDSEKAPNLPLIVNTPLLFNWKDHPLRDKIITDGKGKFDVRFDITQLRLTGGGTYYVDAVNGNDSNDGLSLANAIKNIKTVFPKLNDNDTLYIADGNYFRANGTLFTSSFNKSINMIALGDNVNMIMADEPAWVKTSGKQNVYEVTRSAAKRVINLNNMLGRTPQEFKPVSSIDLVETTLNSFFTDNVKVYVNSGNVPNNKVVPLLSSTMLRVTNPTGNFYMENINFFGGNSSARFELTSANNVYLNKMNLQFSCQTNGNGLEVVGGNTIISVNSEASNNWMDGFNYHIGTDGSKPNTIEINCVALENGYEKGTAGDKSNNGSTIHDGLKAIRINGSYGRNDGGNIADVNAETQSWNLGCVEFESYQGKGYQVSSGSQLFLDNCMGYGSTNSIHCGNVDSKIYTRLGNYQSKMIVGEEIKY